VARRSGRARLRSGGRPVLALAGHVAAGRRRGGSRDGARAIRSGLPPAAAWPLR
jgi:hypothetical protein